MTGAERKDFTSEFHIYSWTLDHYFLGLYRELFTRCPELGPLRHFDRLDEGSRSETDRGGSWQTGLSLYLCDHPSSLRLWELRGIHRCTNDIRFLVRSQM